MPNNDLTEIAVILDRSGSMQSIRADMEGGYAAFLAEQRASPSPCVVSLYQFDDRFDVVYQEVPLASAPGLSLVPRGSTALLDALGRSIVMIGERLAAKAEHERPGKIVVMVVTDGQENASREFTRELVREKVKHQTDVYGWQFAFLGANIDSFGEAASLGIAGAAVGNFQANAAGVDAMYASASAGVRAYRSAGLGASLHIDPAEDTPKGAE